MFERYTEIARQTLVAAKSKASQVGSAEIHPEHLLWGLLTTDKLLADRFVLSSQPLEAVRMQIEQQRTPDRNTIPAPADIPLSRACKFVLVFAAEEADKLSSKHVGTEHLLLALVREGKSSAAKILSEAGFRLASAREELRSAPHHPRQSQRSVRNFALPSDVVELQFQISSITNRMKEAIAKRDFLRARALSDEERREREKLLRLYEEHGLDL